MSIRFSGFVDRAVSMALSLILTAPLTTTQRSAQSGSAENAINRSISPALIGAPCPCSFNCRDLH